MSLALLPGSYDPMTLGHLDLVKRAVSLYGEAVVAIMNNPNKQYKHTMAERLEMARLTVGANPAVRVVCDEGLTVDLFDKLGADVIVKGVRNADDRAYEEKMANWNIAQNPHAKTVLLEAADDFETLHSTTVREMIEQGMVPNGLVAPSVIKYLREKGELPMEDGKR